MKGKLNRQTVDLSTYPDLVVIYLGMRANTLKGVRSLARLGPQIAKAVEAEPEGLLRHENMIFSLLPLHLGMRQYWRDFDALEQWSHSLPHKQWWQAFVRDPEGTGFWHETYFMRGGMETIYDDMFAPIGMMHFAPLQPARGAMFSARKRLRVEGEGLAMPSLTEQDVYGESEEAQLGVR